MNAAPGFLPYTPDAASDDELVATSWRDERYEKEAYYRVTLGSGHDVGIGLESARPWLDVFLRARRKGDVKGSYTGDYTMEGFSLEEWRWSYPPGPPGSGELRRIIYTGFDWNGATTRFVSSPAERERRWIEGERLQDTSKKPERAVVARQPARRGVAAEEPVGAGCLLAPFAWLFR